MVEVDDPLMTETLFPDIIKLAQSYEIEWDESDLNRLQQSLTESIEKEAVAFSLFFGN